jgi:hypothetical protein
VLVPVTLEKFVNALPLVAPHFDEGRVCACRVYMLLGFRGSTKAASGLVSTQSYRRPFGKIAGMCHPVEDMLCPPPYLSR